MTCAFSSRFCVSIQSFIAWASASAAHLKTQLYVGTAARKELLPIRAWAWTLLFSEAVASRLRLTSRSSCKVDARSCRDER